MAAASGEHGDPDGAERVREVAEVDETGAEECGELEGCY